MKLHILRIQSVKVAKQFLLVRQAQGRLAKIPFQLGVHRIIRAGVISISVHKMKCYERNCSRGFASLTPLVERINGKEIRKDDVHGEKTKPIFSAGLTDVQSVRSISMIKGQCIWPRGPSLLQMSLIGSEIYLKFEILKESHI